MRMRAIQSCQPWPGNEDVGRLPLEKGVDVNPKGKKHIGTTLQVALWGGNENVVKLLLKKGANVNAEESYSLGNKLRTFVQGEGEP